MEGVEAGDGRVWGREGHQQAIMPNSPSSKAIFFGELISIA